jgi:hypothetical protein
VTVPSRRLVVVTTGGSFTVVVAVAVLLAVLGSFSVAVMVAVLVIVPATVGVTTSVTVIVPPLAIPPRLQVTVPLTWLQVPWLGVADTKVTPAGRVSVRVTPVALLGPALLTVRL